MNENPVAKRLCRFFAKRHGWGNEMADSDVKREMAGCKDSVECGD